MNAPERIPETLELVEAIWLLYPDMRLGQLVCNIADWAEESVWDIEEDAVVREIETHLRNLERIQRGEIEALRQTD